MPEGWPGLEIGWALGREFWGKGLAYEAAKKVLDDSFSNMGIDELISLIHPENFRSIKLAQRLGETLYDYTKVIGMECAIYRITRTRWLEQQNDKG